MTFEKINMVIRRFQTRLGMLVMLLLVFLIIATGFVWSQKKITVTVDGKTMEIHTLATDPQEILRAAGVALNPLDEYRLSTEKVVSGTRIQVCRAVPVQVIYQGNSRTLITAKPTVGELAAAMGYVGEQIMLVPNADTEITEGMMIKIVTLRDEMVEEVQPIAFQVIHRSDTSMEKGSEQQVQAGENGLKKVILKRSFADNEQAGEQIISETVLQQARPMIIAVGARDVVQTSRGMKRFRDIAWMEATAYNPTDGSGTGITATGVAARHGIVAVDPEVIPLGTRLYIPGYGMALAADTGGDIVGNRIDLCMEGYQEAWSFGRRNVKVYILE